MPVMSREALEGSTLSDLHSIAAELDIDGYRRMRKGELIAAILGEEYAGEEPGPAEAEAEGDGKPGERERPRRSRSRSRRSSREGDRASEPEESVDGTIEVLDNGSGFVRLSPPDPSDGDVYVSAAQIRRCELVSGDRVTGPVRPPRRSERYPSLVRVETINDRPADEVADGTPYEKLGAAFPATAFALGSDRPELVEVAERAPLGRGSRVTVSGPFASGRSTLLRSLAGAIGAIDGVEVAVVLAGARPEELAEWQEAGIEPAAVAPLGASQESQSQVVDRAVEAARRSVARGGEVALLVDSLDGVGAASARRALAAARNVPEGGSLTVIAATREPLGGETTVIALDAAEGAKAGHPVVDPARSATLRAQALAAG